MRHQRRDRSSMLARIFGLDVRSLALFRIGLALFILYDVVSRSFDLAAHYTDFGVLPRDWAMRYYTASPIYSAWNPAWLSLHFLTGSALGISVLFGFQGIVAFALLIGYRTRLATFLSWFLLASLQARNL